MFKGASSSFWLGALLGIITALTSVKMVTDVLVSRRSTEVWEAVLLALLPPPPRGAKHLQHGPPAVRGHPPSLLAATVPQKSLFSTPQCGIMILILSLHSLHCACLCAPRKMSLVCLCASRLPTVLAS